ncbi:MAG: ferritin, partial [Thermotoga sp.]
MISKKIEEAINKQINEEMFSSYLYLSMTAYFDSLNLKGFANWMMVQQKEEMDHAMKFYRYL